MGCAYEENVELEDASPTRKPRREVLRYFSIILHFHDIGMKRNEKSEYPQAVGGIKVN